MTIKQQGGIFGRNPTFNDVTVDGTLTASGTISLPNDSVSGDAINGGDATLDNLTIDNAGLIQLTKNTSAQGDSLGIVEFHDEDGAAGADAGKFQLQAFRGGDKDAPTFKLIGSDSLGTLTDRLEIGSAGEFTVGSNNLYVSPTSKSVGINTNNPNLHGWTQALTLDTTANTAIELSRDGTKKAAFALQGDDRIQITSFEADPIQLRTANADRLVVSGTGDGDVTISTGNLVIGTSGKGIDFSATSGTGTSELFDDYEEGNWTPTYTTDGTDFDSVNYDSRTHGRYVKIGSLVYVSCVVYTDSITVGSASGDVLIGGLPFTVSNDPSNAEGYTGAVSSAAFTGDHPSVGFAMRNSTTIKLQYRATANGAVSDLQIADLNTGANDNFLQLALSYRV